MEILIPERIRQRVANIQQSINDLYRSQSEVVSIFLDSKGDVPDGLKWHLNKEGTHVILDTPDEPKEVDDTDKNSEE